MDLIVLVVYGNAEYITSIGSFEDLRKQCEKLAGSSDYKLFVRSDNDSWLQILTDSFQLLTRVAETYKHSGRFFDCAIAIKTSAELEHEKNVPKKASEVIQCSFCKISTFTRRFTCSICPDYVLCVMCEKKGIHSEHDMARYRVPHGMSANSLLTAKKYKLKALQYLIEMEKSGMNSGRKSFQEMYEDCLKKFGGNDDLECGRKDLFKMKEINRDILPEKKMVRSYFLSLNSFGPPTSTTKRLEELEEKKRTTLVLIEILREEMELEKLWDSFDDTESENGTLHNVLQKNPFELFPPLSNEDLYNDFRKNMERFITEQRPYPPMTSKFDQRENQGAHPANATTIDDLKKKLSDIYQLSSQEAAKAVAELSFFPRDSKPLTENLGKCEKSHQGTQSEQEKVRILKKRIPEERHEGQEVREEVQKETTSSLETSADVNMKVLENRTLKEILQKPKKKILLNKTNETWDQ